MNRSSRRVARLYSNAASAAGLTALLALMACGSAPPVVAPPVRVEVAVPPELPLPVPRQSAFERSQREWAIALMQQRRLADAAVAWEILALLRPDVDVYRERLVQTQRQIDERVAERLPQAAHLLHLGQLDEAFQQYLAVLALQPDNAAAAEALRRLERDRNARQHLGKLSRNTITRHAVAQSETSTPVRRAARMGTGIDAGVGAVIGAETGAEIGTDASSDTRSRLSTANASRMATRSSTANEVEHAALLAGDGEIDEAIRLLEDRLVAERRDAAARRLLASLYYRKAESLATGDRPAAIAALQASLRLDPAEPRTTVLLRSLGWTAKAPLAPSAAPTAGKTAAKTEAPKRHGVSGPPH